MTKKLIICLIITIFLVGCGTEKANDNKAGYGFEAMDSSEYSGGSSLTNSGDAPTEEAKDNKAGYSFEAVDSSEYGGGSFLTDFSDAPTEEEAALIEGKLLTLFGAPCETSENYEDSFNYYIRVTSDDGRSVVLNVYNVGVVHIGCSGKDDFETEAAKALIDYVTPAKPTGFSRTVYYLDLNLQIDISVKDGKAVLRNSELTEEKANELFEKFCN